MAQAVEDWTNYLKDSGSTPAGGFFLLSSLKELISIEASDQLPNFEFRFVRFTVGTK